MYLSYLDPSRQNPHLAVSGSDRYKYSRRPIIPFLQQVPPDVLLQTTRVDPTMPPPEQQQSRPPTPLTWTVGVQTMYRESEAQTGQFSFLSHSFSRFCGLLKFLVEKCGYTYRDPYSFPF